MSNVKSATCWAMNTALRRLILLLLLHDGTCTSSAIELGLLCAIQMMVGSIKRGQRRDLKRYSRSDSRGFEDVGEGERMFGVWMMGEEGTSLVLEIPLNSARGPEEAVRSQLG